MKHFCLKLEILVEFILLYCKFVRNNFMIYTVSVWNMYWVRSTCGSKWEKPTTDNGKFTVEHRARSRMGNRHRSTKLFALNNTTKTAKRSTIPIGFVHKCIWQEQSQQISFSDRKPILFSSSSSFPLSDIISKIFLSFLFLLKRSR